MPERIHLVEFAPLSVGLVALVGATMLGSDAGLLEAIVSLPFVVRLALAGASLIGAVSLLGAAVARMDGHAGAGGYLVTLLRGIRLGFLALAALSVALGWALGSALPFVVALVIAGIDVIETSFLLIVVHRGRE